MPHTPYPLAPRLCRNYHASQNYTSLHAVQEESSQFFTARLERLKFSLDLTDEALADRIGLSRRMLWLVRTGKSKASKKSLWKLTEAERAAGIDPPADKLTSVMLAMAGPVGTEAIRAAERARGAAAPPTDQLRAAIRQAIEALQRVERLLGEGEEGKGKRR